MTRRQRREVLLAARAASAAGDVVRARELFASVGIDYIPAITN